MSAKKIIYIAIGLAVLILNLFKQFSVTTEDVPEPVSAALTVKVFDIGQGDAILIRSGKDVVLIDSGDVDMRGRLLKLLEKERIKEFSLAVATHPHSDHMGGMAAVLDKFPVKKILDSGQPHNGKLFNDYLKKVRDKKIPFVKTKAGDRYELDTGAYLEVLWPESGFLHGTDGDLNNNSMVLRLVKDDFSMLLTGDIQREAELSLVKNNREKIKSVVLKAPHHASNTSSTSAFLRVAGSKAVIVSCGRNNDYGYPKPQVIRRYQEQGMDTYVTAADGTITVSTDGRGYKITKEINK